MTGSEGVGASDRLRRLDGPQPGSTGAVAAAAAAAAVHCHCAVCEW
jgi:hypothetical protein